MEFDVVLLNCLKYKDKKDGSEKSRLGYVHLEGVSETPNYVGLPELSVFTNNTKLFTALADKKIALMQATLVFRKVPSTRNPLKDYNELVEIRLDDENISLL